MSRDHYDILIDQLLREILGGDRPRDLTDRVMARAREYDRVRRRWWIGSASALAACLALAATLYLLWPAEYRVPQVVDGTVNITNGDILQRGARLVTDETDRATVDLGGYVKVSMEPQTALTLGGEKYKEQVRLEQGDVNVAVTKHRGEFDVLVNRATVHVTGTRFHVGVVDKLLEKENRRVKNLNVSVEEGSVEVALGDGSRPVQLIGGSAANEKTWEISSQSIKRVVGPGVLGGASAGARMGARAAGRGMAGAAGVRPPPATEPSGLEFTPLGGTGGIGRGGRFGVMHVLVPRGHVELRGILRQERELYFVQTENGPYLLFPQQQPLANLPPTGSNVRVQWENGRLIRIEKLEPPEPNLEPKPEPKPAPELH